MVLSVPTVPADLAGALLDMSPQAVWEALGDAQPAQVCVLVDIEVSRRKRVRTSKALDQPGAALPVSVQFMHVIHQDTEGPMRAFPDGAPTVIDALALAPWPVLRAGLCRWETEPVPGGLRC